MRILAPLPLFLLLAACTAQTSSSGNGGGNDASTTGQNGHLQFSYVSSQCALGCGLGSPVVQGALITIQASGGDPSVAYTMAVSPASLGTVMTTETCTCTSSSADSASGRTVGVTDKCNSDETKSCIVSGDVQTAGAGTATIQVIDPSGSVFDSAPFTIAPADRIDQTVTVAGQKATAATDGSFSAHVGDQIQIHSVVYSGGKSMVFTKHGLEPSYSDQSVVAPDTSVLLGATDTEYAVAKAPGDASVTMTAIGAKATVVVHVSQ